LKTARVSERKKRLAKKNKTRRDEEAANGVKSRQTRIINSFPFSVKFFICPFKRSGGKKAFKPPDGIGKGNEFRNIKLAVDTISRRAYLNAAPSI
jgi:hypothetical protein